jgi:hypothetical protein
LHVEPIETAYVARESKDARRLWRNPPTGYSNKPRQHSDILDFCTPKGKIHPANLSKFLDRLALIGVRAMAIGKLKIRCRQRDFVVLFSAFMAAYAPTKVSADSVLSFRCTEFAKSSWDSSKPNFRGDQFPPPASS